MFVFDRGQEGAMERLTSREGDTFETAINVHGPFSGMGEYSYYSSLGGGWQWAEEIPPLDDWQHVAYVADADNEELNIYVDGELTWTTDGSWIVAPTGFMHVGNRHNNVEGFDGLMDDVALWDEVLSSEDIKTIASVGVARFLDPNAGGTVLQAGDADQDLDFDQLDLVKVQIAAKYLTGESATWGEGDWNGAPGGKQGEPPAGDGFFNQGDIIASLSAGKYLTGPYGALTGGSGNHGDEQTSLVYDAKTGELSVDPPVGKDLTSINITSAGSKFIGDKPAVLDGAFDNFAGDNIFKATFGGSFAAISFGNALPAGLASSEVVADLSAVGSLAGGGDLGDVDLIYIPEPSTWALILLGLVGLSRLHQVRSRRA